MSDYQVSFAVRQGIVAVVISESGSIVDKYVRKIPSSIDGQYKSLLYVFNLALKHLDKVLAGKRADVVFEHSNYTFAKWVECQYSKPEYQEEFNAAMLKLQRLPVRYSFVHNPKPRAALFCSDKYVKREEFVS